MVTKKLILLISLFFIKSSCAWAMDKCPAYNPSILFTSKVGPTKYNRSLSIDELNAKHNSGGTVRGTMASRVSVATDVQYEYVHHKSVPGYYCLKFKKIKVEFIAKPVINIAKEYNLSSCEYKKVLQHENQHVRILKQTHQEYGPKFKQYVKQSARKAVTLTPMEGPKLEVEQNRLYKALIEDINSYADKINAINSNRQAKIDTPDEYEQIGRRCRSW